MARWHFEPLADTRPALDARLAALFTQLVGPEASQPLPQFSVASHRRRRALRITHPATGTTIVDWDGSDGAAEGDVAFFARSLLRVGPDDDIA
jgi:hypothetical protein